jgi:asparagine synthase (glutamine-hydrolysing)
MAFDVYSSLVDEMLTKVDFASMLASLEVRVPFLDHRIVEFGLSLPAEYKICNKKNKLILREAYVDRLPSEIMNAPKRGFNLPLDNWIRNYWSDSFKMIFANPFLKELGIDQVSLNNLYEKYLGGFPVNGKLFYYIFILVSWYEKLKIKRE